MPHARYWVGVVSHAHVMVGVEGGFIMLNHGKEAPLKRLTPGDHLIYYSPTEQIKGKPLKAFTAIAEILDTPTYQATMPSGFTPFRRDVRYLSTKDVPIADIKSSLEFAQGSWGMLARRGVFEINAEDFAVICNAMTGGTNAN